MTKKKLFVSIRLRRLSAWFSILRSGALFFIAFSSSPDSFSARLNENGELNRKINFLSIIIESKWME